MGANENGSGRGGYKSPKCAWKVSDEPTRAGKRLESNEQVNPLPPVGSRVIVLCKEYFSQTKADGVTMRYYADKAFHDHKRGSYNKIYRVSSYTRGTEDPFASNNHVVLTEERTGVKQSIPVRCIATGFYKLRMVAEDYDEKRDRSYDERFVGLDGLPYPEDIYGYEDCGWTPYMERIIKNRQKKEGQPEEGNLVPT